MCSPVGNWHSHPVAKSAHCVTCNWIPCVFSVVCNVSFSGLSNQFQSLVHFGSSYQHNRPPSPYPSSFSTDSISVTGACFPYPLQRVHGWVTGICQVVVGALVDTPVLNHLSSTLRTQLLIKNIEILRQAYKVCFSAFSQEITDPISWLL